MRYRKRRYAPKRRRGFKRRRTFRKRSKKAYDIVHCKMDVVRPVTHRTAVGFAHICTNWSSVFADAGGNAADYIDITDSPEFT